MRKIKNYLSLILAVAICLSATSMATFAAPDDSNTHTEAASTSIQAQGFNKALENDTFSLAFDSKTTNIALTDKRTGVVTYATPINAASDTVAAGDAKNNLRSTIIAYYYDGTNPKSANSWFDSVEKENYEWKVKDGVLSVTYKMGDDTISRDQIPMVISAERMDKFMSKLDEDEKNSVLSYFTLYEADKLKKESIEAMSISFPTIGKFDIYVRKNIPIYKVEGIYTLLTKAGYTNDELQKDCDENEIKNAYTPKPYFVMTIDYRLTDDGLNVSLDPTKIEYNSDYKPYRIEILPYFGATDTSDTGYMLVPDGSGSIINFNNEKKSSDPYYSSFFANDSVVEKMETLSNKQLSLLPVFALSAQDYGFLATVDSGYEIGGVGADISGRFNTYNNVYAFFDIAAAESVSISVEAFYMYSKIFGQEISITYHMTTGNTSYSDFAMMYRSYLQKNGMLPKKSNKDSTVLNIDFMSSALVTKRFFGFPYEKIVPLTTYSQALDVLGQLGDVDADVNFVNALKGGYTQKEIGKIDLLSCLGDKDDLNALKKKVNNLSVSYYATKAEKIKNSECVKTMKLSSAHNFKFDTVSRYRLSSDFYLILATSKLESYISKLQRSLKKEKLEAVNILDIAYELNSNYASGEETDRYDARVAYQNYLEKISESTTVTVDQGSVYTFPYIDKIRNIPTGDSSYKVEDYDIPFYQIVVSGIIPYTTSSINQASDMKSQFLSAVEVGAQLQFTWLYKSATNTVRSSENYYGIRYEDTLELAKSCVEAYRDVYSEISGAGIVNHTIIDANLRKTEFENGIVIYVNYGQNDAEVDGITVSAKNFAVSKEENR